MKVIKLTLKAALDLSLSGKHNCDLYVLDLNLKTIKPMGDYALDELKFIATGERRAIVQLTEGIDLQL